MTISLETPCVLIDTEIMARNIATMAERVQQHGVQLRPHAKTHKLPVVAHQQIDAGAVGITVAKVSEAEVMAAHGIMNIFIAYPLVTASKIERAIRLSEEIELLVGVDSLAGAKLMEQTAAKHGHMLQVRLEIDTGLRRTGVPYEAAEALALEIAGMPHLRLTGIYTFRGALLAGKPTLDVAAAGLEEGQLMARLADRLRAAGIAIADVSVGSTPTALYAAAVPGVTEVRPGTYVYQDRMQAQLGVCGLGDSAGSVLVTVVSRPSADLAIIDGGSKTFATDVQPGTHPLQLRGFGHIHGLEDALLVRMTEEHGMIELGPSAQAADLKVGDQLRIIPNHICSTINLHNHVVMQRGDTFERLPVLARGMLE
ncbi:alanine racemase [Paenibacillus qinlingensis]|uniref:D-serine deaminase-like pyridoxal phosphate-dependent protein n=1 Tax=Paenibacillus qinlingensis TaxID=1837343 RepID=A0ABU1P824_9BACL|nr:alanine racemase [Paenibacillus qinlingensis]MDR6555202.1 D-serine deaminase-like pyridoxal phosphate-dependent protein [Paenibacillus qinlingensis]